MTRRSRVSSPFLPLVLFAAAPLFGGCASTPPESKPPAPAPASDDTSSKAADLERQMRVARMRLEKSKLDTANQQLTNEDTIHRAEVDLALAKEGLTQFEDRDSKTRLEKGRLNLKRMEDALDESKEELAQLEMMYQEQDLADKTREIVLRRGKRRVERTEAALAIEKQELEQLERQVLPLERKKLAMDVDGKARALEAARRAAKDSAFEREIAATTAAQELEKLELELDKLRGTAKPAAAPSKSAAAPAK
jgi:hypothetical protein